MKLKKYWILFLLLAGFVFISSLLKLDHNYSDGSSISRGRKIYIEEGCIHCHSQYVRPDSIDMERWGIYEENLSAPRSLLIGNRRQGPDLSHIGIRRSREWNKFHLNDPQFISPNSRMPNYSHLFMDKNKGNDLLDYLESLGQEHREEWLNKQEEWSAAYSINNGSIENGKALYMQSCSQCHGSNGQGDGRVSASLSRAAPDLTDKEWIWVDDNKDRNQRLARIIKFGIMGTNMPGHEWLNPQEIADIIQFLDNLQQ
jgi:cytochrome c oxidase cbb3-type subunit 2